MKIFLVGMPGSGKSTIGKLLAQELSMPFVDLDIEIESREGKAVPEVFAQNGEDYFRLVESKTLLEWAGTEKNFVMSTGGGAPCFYNGIDVINSSGLSIFLDVDVPVLLSRLENKTDRPLLQSSQASEMKEKLMTLRASRLACYRKAHIHVAHPDVQKVLSALGPRMNSQG